MPANNANDIIAHFTFDLFSIIMSASNDGILDSIKKKTTPIVPAIIIITFQSTAESTFPKGSIPNEINNRAEAKAI